MHQPRHFQEKDIQRITRLVHENPLGALVLATSENFEVNHIPFVLDSVGSDFDKLRAHIPRANPLAELVVEPQRCVVIFQGGQGYISPSWYATKQVHGRVVPTWNYAVVHVHGTIQMVDDSVWIVQQLEDLTEQNEQIREDPWQISDAPREYVDRQLSQLIGIEITIDKLEAKTKASQNQPKGNRDSVLQSLIKEQPDSELTDLMHGLSEGD